MNKTSKVSIRHRFLDEAGDTTFYLKGKIPAIGSNGVSACFILGLVKFRGPLEQIRQRIVQLQKDVENDRYYKGVRSIEKKKARHGFCFHATDDPAEVRKTFYEFINDLNCSCEAVVARKNLVRFERKHNRSENEFYADLLSHLIKNKFQKDGKLVFNIAKRGTSTRNSVLELAKEKAIKRFSSQGSGSVVKTEIAFNVQNHLNEPLLNVADYFCWALQRVFERGETRYYDFISEKISVIVDLYDHKNFDKRGNFYDSKKPLTAKNKISPPIH